MNKQAQQQLIDLHTALLFRAKRILNEHYWQLEADGQEMQWLKEYEKQLMILDWLRNQTPNED